MAKLASTVLTYVGWAQTYQSFSVGDVEVLELPLESVGFISCCRQPFQVASRGK